MLYGGCPGNGGGPIEGTGEAVGAAVFRLVVECTQWEITQRAGDVTEWTEHIAISISQWSLCPVVFNS